MSQRHSKDQAFDWLLKSSVSKIEPSGDFEQRFWNKVLERPRPWFQMLAGYVESLMPVPGAYQVAGVLLLSFFIGSAGGVLAVMAGPSQARIEDRQLIRYLSGFPEYQGVPSVSVAGSYLKNISEGGEG